MTGDGFNSASETITNEFKGDMVIALFVMIFCMVIDRVLYSSMAFTSRKALSEKLDTDSPIISNETTSEDK
jgi:hypothetical protein